MSWLFVQPGAHRGPLGVSQPRTSMAAPVCSWVGLSEGAGLLDSGLALWAPRQHVYALVPPVIEPGQVFGCIAILYPKVYGAPAANQVL